MSSRDSLREMGDSNSKDEPPEPIELTCIQDLYKY